MSEKETKIDTVGMMQALLDYVGMKAPSFAKEIGVPYQRIFNLQCGRTKRFSTVIANLIVDKFPEVNKTYLLTGEGELVVPTATKQGEPLGALHLSELFSMQKQLMEEWQSQKKREAELSAREAEIMRREAMLDVRECALLRREAELGMAESSGLKKEEERKQA